LRQQHLAICGGIALGLHAVEATDAFFAECGVPIPVDGFPEFHARQRSGPGLVQSVDAL
jgi:hypothetical protein